MDRIAETRGSVVVGLDRAATPRARHRQGGPLVVQLAVGIPHEAARLHLQVEVPADLEARLREALESGRRPLVVTVEGAGERSEPPHRPTPEPDPGIERLSRAERNVLDLLAEGLTNRQIAERLFLAPKTVKNYVSSLLSKLGMSRRTEAAVYAALLRSAAAGTETASAEVIRFGVRDASPSARAGAS
jgi:DNA-binding CsgD family transcriptional regulator